MKTFKIIVRKDGSFVADLSKGLMNALEAKTGQHCIRKSVDVDGMARPFLQRRMDYKKT